MKNKSIKAMCAATALCFAVSGCSGNTNYSGFGGNSGSSYDPFGGNGTGWSDTTSSSTSSSSNTETASGGGDIGVVDERDFGDSGSILSMEDGELNIERLTHENEKPMGDDDWTILVYLCGTDLETDGGNACADLYEAFEADCKDNVNFVFQTGGTNLWYYDDISATKTQRFIMEENDYRLVDEQPLTSMGDPDTLADFVEWGVKEYPANNIGLVFWNHGGGSLSGVCFDERYDGDSLSLSEIDKALSDTFDCMTEKFEFIGFDACLMSTFETANILVPYANYMYASEEVEPGYGWDYTAIIDYLNANPEADGAQLGKALCDSYYEHCKLSWSEDGATFAITDLNKIDALVKSFNITAQQMYESDKITSIVKDIQSVDNFGGNNRTEGYTNMVDLGGILEVASDYCSNASDTLRKLDDAICYMKNGYQHYAASGLAIYYPLAIEEGSADLSVFGGICPSSYYLAFVDKVAYGTTGEDIVSYDNGALVNDYDDIWDIDYDYGDYGTNTDEFVDIGDACTIPVADIYFDDEGYYTVAISDFSNLSYAACSLFLEDTDGTSIYLGCDDEVYYDWDNGIITDNFDGTWVSLPDGQPLPIEIVSKTDDYSLYTCSILLNGEYTNLRIEYDWNGSCWNILGAWDGVDDVTGMASRDIVQIEDGDVIQPVYYYIDYYTSDYFAGDEYVVNGNIDLSYQMLPASDYTYSITLYDIYGNWYFTPDVTFTVEEDGSLTFYPDELEDYNGGGYDDGYDDGGYSDYEYVTCSECYGTGCDWCGYYGYLLSYPCEACWGSGCSECDWYGDFLAIACEYCNGAGCDYCYEYY